MGLHYPFGYVGYETTFLETFIHILDNFCSSCHTNDDVGGNCKLCPIGNLIYASKDYVLDAYESDIIKEEARVLRKIKKEIKNIEPRPMFNVNFIFEKRRRPDKLIKLRELLKDLKFLDDGRMRSFELSQKLKGKIRKQVESKLKKLKLNKTRR